MNMTSYLKGGILCLILAQYGCATKPRARDVWFNGLSRCADGAPLSVSNLVYLGLSNTLGPGSGWRRTSPKELVNRFSFESAVTNTARRSSMLRRGQTANCSVFEKETWSIEPSVAVTSIAPQLRATLGMDFSGVKTVDATIRSWRIDSIEELLYENWMLSEQSGEFGKDLLRKDRDPRLVMNTGVAVQGLSVTIKLDQSQAAKLDATLPVNAALQLQPGLTVRRGSNLSVAMTSEREFYIIGTFVPVRSEGVLGALPSGVGGPLDRNSVSLPDDLKVKP